MGGLGPARKKVAVSSGAPPARSGGPPGTAPKTVEALLDRFR